MPAARGAVVAASGSLLDQSINAETAESTENAESHLYKRSLRVLRFLCALRSRGRALRLWAEARDGGAEVRLGIVPELDHLRMAIERRLHDAARHDAASRARRAGCGIWIVAGSEH